MGRPLTILFGHRTADPLTRTRLANLIRLNPGVPIVPVTTKSAGPLPGTFSAEGAPDLPDDPPWSGADLALYAWFRHGRTEATTADRYAVVEYDMLFTVSATDYYRPVWDADLAAAQLFFAGPHYHWSWFAQSVALLPPKFRPFVAGAVPLAGTLLSHRALAAASAGPIPPGVFCECRLATLVNAAGLEMTEFPYAYKRSLSWRPEFIRLDRPAPAYHPVKTLTPLDNTSEAMPDHPAGAQAESQIQKFVPVVQRCLLATEPRLLPLLEPLFLVPTHMSFQERLALFNAARSLRPGFTACEVGSCVGASACFLAAAASQSGGHVHCVDAWNNDAMGVEGADDAYPDFLKNTHPFRHFITTHRGPAAQQAESVPGGLDLLFLDGDHSYEAVLSNLTHYAPKLRPGGLLAMHDFHWQAVQAAWSHFSVGFAARDAGRTHSLQMFVLPSP